ncbi:MAG: hypothetical protein HKN43_01255 [Rhodothermales bacterium]|nr:hypothetical protein [Rhodothermales bacterium]
MTWSDFFPADTEVQALPSWRSPRLYIPAASIKQRWRRSAFFPAYRKSAILFRAGLRTAVTVKPSTRKTNGSEKDWGLGLFVRNVLPLAQSVSLLVGTDGPAQKATLQLCDGDDNVIGYVKYGETASAIAGIRNEVDILRTIPEDLCPQLLHAGEFAEGFAMVTSNIEGSAIPASLPPVEDVVRFQDRLVSTETAPADSHPALKEILQGEKRNWVTTLCGKDWPIALQHGDFAPWNLKKCGAQIRAFDWEYATTTGFPYLDLAFFSLQTDVKIYHAQPGDAFQRAKTILAEHPQVGPEYAAVIVRIAAFDAFDKGIRDGHDPDAALQAWYRGVWEAQG